MNPSGLKRLSHERSAVVWPLMNFRDMCGLDQRLVAFIDDHTIFRELTGLNDFLGYTQREEIGRGWELRYRVLRRSR